MRYFLCSQHLCCPEQIEGSSPVATLPIAIGASGFCSLIGNPPRSIIILILLNSLRRGGRGRILSALSLTIHYSPFTLMITLIRPNRLRLRNKISSIFTVIIWPAIHFWNFSLPVTMAGINGCRPFQGIGTPWICRSYFSSFKNGIEEIKDKHQLHSKHYNRHHRDHFIQVTKLVEGSPAFFIEVPSWYAR